MIDIFLNIIIFLYNLLFQNFGLTIIVIAILTRLIFFPFQKTMLKNSKKMQELSPLLAELKKVHKGDAKGMQEAQMALFKEHGVNPAAGCLPMLAQFVIFALLYQALYQSLNKGLNTSFLFWNLAKPDVVPFSFQGKEILLPGILVVLSSLTQYIQSMMMMPEPVKVEKNDTLKEAEVKKETSDELTQASQSMTWMFPLIFLFFGTQWPSALALYWTVSTIIGIYQQYQITGLGALKKFSRFLPINK